MIPSNGIGPIHDSLITILVLYVLFLSESLPDYYTSNMSEEINVETNCADTTFSCRKCRQKLISADCLVDEHAVQMTQPVQLNKSSCLGADGNQCQESTVWFVNEHNMPDWIETIINEANWIKGKVLCPKCKSRLGSFDFVSGSKCSCGNCVLPPVHIVKAKVDLKDPHSVPFIRRPSGTEEFVDAFSDSDELEKHETEDSKEFPGKSKTILPLICEGAASSYVDTSTMSETGLDTLAVGTSQIKTKKFRKTSKLTKKNEVSETRDKKSAENETSEIKDVPLEPPEDIICPVCLDIYTNPFVCYPCVHVFCEICLRRIAKNNPQKTLCPLCRQPIGMCLPDHERCHKVRTLFPTAHKSRQKSLQHLRNFPLPWQPHYRLRQLSSIGRSFLWSERDHIRVDGGRSAWDTISTIGLLVFLQIIAMLAFVVGYQGSKCAIGILEVIELFAENFMDIVFGNFGLLWIPERLVDNFTL
ncbi:hypothetical protein CHUAL_002315 [Chamberlinius hualienensis]